MQKTDLLDKAEMYQFELLHLLVESGGYLPKKMLLAKLKIGNYFLLRLLDTLHSFAKTHPATFSIEWNTQYVTLEMQANYSIQTFYQKLILHSIKYHILEELFTAYPLEIAKFCDKLGISPSTYFRKTKELNQILQEFDLSIQNGRLIGSESQIRFFYTYFCLITKSNHSIQSYVTDPRIFQIIKELQQATGASFSETAQKKLAIYLSFVKRRYVHKTPQYFNTQYPFLQHLLTKRKQQQWLRTIKKWPFFEKLHELTVAFLTYYSFKPFSHETILLFLFLIGEEILPIQAPSYQDLLNIEQNNRFPVSEMLTTFFNFMKKQAHQKNLPEQKKQLLTYYLLTSFYHYSTFKGQVDLTWGQESTTEKIAAMSVKYDSLLHALMHDYPTFFKNLKKNTFLLSKYTYAIYFYEYYTSKPLSIGIFIQGDLLQSDIYTNSLIHYIDMRGFIKAEAFRFDKTYHVIISNVDSSTIKRKGEHFLFISQQKTQTDLKMISHFLDKLTDFE